jgi:hypothetical protein
MADMDRYATSPGLQTLTREGLPWGAELIGVTNDLHKGAHRLENKVLRVTQEGETLWGRQ